MRPYGLDTVQHSGCRVEDHLTVAVMIASLCFFISESSLSPSVYAQVSAPITASGLNTQISTPANLPGGKVQYDITGGLGLATARICSIALVSLGFPTITLPISSMTRAERLQIFSDVSRAEIRQTSLAPFRLRGLGMLIFS